MGLVWTEPAATPEASPEASPFTKLSIINELVVKFSKNVKINIVVVWFVFFLNCHIQHFLGPECRSYCYPKCLPYKKINKNYFYIFYAPKFEQVINAQLIYFE